MVGMWWGGGWVGGALVASEGVKSRLRHPSSGLLGLLGGIEGRLVLGRACGCLRGVRGMGEGEVIGEEGKEE